VLASTAVNVVKRPPWLRPGDLVAIIAASSPFDRSRYPRGEAWLRERYRLTVRDDLLAQQGYLAGSDERRSAELRDALANPEVRAIVAARGGYGATRICASLDWPSLAASPKWIVGFSDVTALHVEASRAGVCSMHGPMAAWLGDSDETARERWLDAIEGRPLEPWHALEVVVPGRARGPAFGGNLALLDACAAAGRLEVPEGCVLFLEDCTEKPYRIDRMLTALLVGGHLSRARALVVGGMTDCPTGPDGVTVDEVVRERTRTLGLPCVMGAPFGHGARNDAFTLGTEVEMIAEDGTGRVEFGKP